MAQMMGKPMMSMARRLAERMHQEMMAGGAARKRKRKRKPGGGPPMYRGKR